MTIEAATARGLYIDAMVDWFTWLRLAETPLSRKETKEEMSAPNDAATKWALFESAYEIRIFQGPAPPRFQIAF